VKQLSALLLIVAFLIGGGQGAEAARRPVDGNLPPLTGRVVDRANIVSAEVEQSLTTKLASLERQTTDQLVVVTLENLRGKPIEDWGRRLGNGWGIGQKNKNNGVLLIVAPNERKVRIEVGLGLESTLSNQRSAEIIDRKILPLFRQGRLEVGIVTGVDSVIDVLEHAAAPRQRKAA
jgi:uncharacterized protein